MAVSLGDVVPDDFRIGDIRPLRLYLGDNLFWNPFQPVYELNTARSAQPVPAGTLQYRVRLRGAGGGGGRGRKGSFQSNPGGGGGGGGAYADTGWRPVSELGSTYLVSVPGQTPEQQQGATAIFVSGNVAIYANGGSAGLTPTNNTGGIGGGDGGTVSSTVTLEVSENGARGGDTGISTFGERDGRPGGNSIMAGPGGGGGSYHPNNFTTDKGGNGGSSAVAAGGVPVGSGWVGDDGDNAPEGFAGGGGSGGGTAAAACRRGGAGGFSGAGGGGGAGGISSDPNGGTGGAGETIIEFI